MHVTLKVIQGPHAGREFAFREHDNFIVGRSSKAHFRLPAKDPYFSRIQFMVEVNPPNCRLVDMRSTNGTLVNGRRVATADLADGDVIEGGDSLIRVAISGLEPPPLPDATAAYHSSLAPSLQQLGRDCDRLDATNNAADAHTIPPQSRSDLLPADFALRVAQQAQPLPGYSIVDEVGRGGMGVVYRAIRKRDQAVVALKSVLPAIAASPADVERFLREAEILRTLQHPSIVAFHEAGEAGGMLFIVMDYVPGVDAADMLRTTGHPFGIGQSVRLICQLLEALDYAHAKGFVHRDIKPANLIIVGEGPLQQLKLTDFGLARTYQQTRMSGLTLLGDIGGTTPFMPPEQITNYREAKPPVDQYSAAATLYRMLTRKHVFDFPPDVTRQFLMIMQSDPVPIRSRRNEIPEELSAVIHKALARHPADRYPDVGKMRRALLPFIGLT